MLNKKALAATAAAQALYVEDVFSTYLYTGTGSTLSINNGIDLSGEGGFVWIKNREAVCDHVLFDTERGAGKALFSNTTGAQQTGWSQFSAFTSTGFNLAGPNTTEINTGQNFASWTFRKAEKFFDVVTYTGDGGFKYVNHNLGSVPGCIIVKRTDSTGNWAVYHRSLGAGYTMYLNTTGASAGENDFQSVSSTQFAVYDDAGSWTNKNGATYVAYLFAHDAGGFGDSGSDNVISCGSYTGNGSTTGPEITLGYEPQWVMVKRSNSTNPWYMVDTMRGFTIPQTSRELAANSSAAEATDYAGAFPIRPLATGFQPYTADNGVNGNGDTYIYIAIRRGPMKTPEAGTEVFSPVTVNNAANTQNTTGFPIDLQIRGYRPGGENTAVFDRLRGVSSIPSSQSIVTGPVLRTTTTAAEASVDDNGYLYDNTSWRTGANWANVSTIYWNFRRAPGFMDVVCYTGTGANRTVAHNLGVAPELIIVKNRSSVYMWPVYSASLLNSEFLDLSSTAGKASGATRWNSTTPTNSVFTVGTSATTNNSTDNFVAYLFASVAGVSKVGSYTGTGTTLQVNCGFTGGARFVLIKRTDSTGDWYVWDTARGIVSGNDPYLLLNSTAAEVTNTDYVDTYSAGFEISSTAPAAINANGGTFIFLAIA